MIRLLELAKEICENIGDSLTVTLINPDENPPDTLPIVGFKDGDRTKVYADFTGKDYTDEDITSVLNECECLCDYQGDVVLNNGIVLLFGEDGFQSTNIPYDLSVPGNDVLMSNEINALLAGNGTFSIVDNGGFPNWTITITGTSIDFTSIDEWRLVTDPPINIQPLEQVSCTKGPKVI